MMNRALGRLRWFLVLVLATQVWAQTAGPTFPDPGKTSMSKEKQQELGMQVAAEVYQQMPVLPDNSSSSETSLLLIGTTLGKNGTGKLKFWPILQKCSEES